MNRHLLYVFALCFGMAARAQAHNGALALAVPVEGIVIDGDFSDWPSASEAKITTCEFSF